MVAWTIGHPITLSCALVRGSDDELDEWMNGSMGWLYGFMDGFMDGYMVYGWLYGWLDSLN